MNHLLKHREAFLVSAAFHMILLALSVRSERPTLRRTTPEVEAPARPREARVYLPPPEVLRELVGPPSVPPPRPAVPQPKPTPPPPAGTKDRISIGPPSKQRAERLILRREDDLTAPQSKGQAEAGSDPASGSPSGETRRAEARPGLRIPPGVGRDRSGEEGTIASALRKWERQLESQGPRGLSTGVGSGRQMGPLYFDPQGADFTVWINHFKNEVYRNWIVPQPALLGFRGHVDLEFTVERDGTLSNLRLLKSAGTPALDRAARNALVSSRFLPLPADFGPPRVAMQVTFYYNGGPHNS